MLTDDEFAAWFRLLETPGLNRGQVRRLLAACGSPDAALSARPATLRELVGQALVEAIGKRPAGFDERLAAALAWRAQGEERHFVAVGDARFPPLLLQTADPPLLLYVQGDPTALARRSLAVVGSRHPTAQGLENARAFARALGDAGLLVVSGLALGIDGAAHEGALAAAAGTLAVVGTGLDRVYPRAHKALAHRIASGPGALVSEFAPGMPAIAANFPQRNRVIAGLSLGTLVVEAALQSGSLITARLALESGREVFAVPGSIHAPQSKGCHALIKQGAKLVESAADILDELGQSGRPLVATGAVTTAAVDPLLEALGFEPTTLDALQARTGWPTAELSAKLLELELDGHVARLAGGLYQRCGLA